MNFDYNETKVCNKCGREFLLDKFKIVTGHILRQCRECYNANRREKAFTKKYETELGLYHQNETMKIQRRYKEPYPYQKLNMPETGIDLLAKDEVFVRLLDYKAAWTSNYGRVIQKLDDCTYKLVKGVYSRTTKELTYTLDRNVYFSSKNR